MQGPRTTFIYLAVVFGLLVIPRALQRFRLPAPLTCFAFGIIVAGFFTPLVHDSVFSYLSTLIGPSPGSKLKLLTPFKGVQTCTCPRC